MPKIHKIKFLPILVIVALIAGSIGVLNVNAAAVPDMVTTSSNQTTGSLTTLTSTWTSIDAIAADDVITMTYGAGATEFDISTANAVTDLTLSVGGAVTVAATCAGTEDFSSSISGQTLILTACTGDFAGAAASSSISVALANVTNGLSTNSPHAVSFAGTTYTDTGSSNVPVIDSADVTVTATVDPTITFSLSSTTCALGTLTTGAVATCTYDVTTATNATNGLTVYVDDQDDANGGALVSGTDTIVCSGTNCDGAGAAGVNLGNQEYGFYISTLNGTNGTGSDHVATGSYGTDSQIVPTASASIMTASGPHDTTASTITHSAAISAITPAGSYSQTVTWTAVGSF